MKIKHIIVFLSICASWTFTFAKEGLYSTTGKPQDEAACKMLDDRVRFTNPKCKTTPSTTEVGVEYLLKFKILYKSNIEDYNAKVKACLNLEEVRPLVSFIKTAKLDADVTFQGEECDVTYTIKDTQLLCSHMKDASIAYRPNNFRLVRQRSDGRKYVDSNYADIREICKN